MGWSTKQVSSDDGSDWSQSLLQARRQLPMKRQQQQHQSTTLGKQMKCPRCGSTSTKFCYYNNYNKSQPRHFCKTCKRHWTKGGTLRNVPVGGSRKNKRQRMKTSPSADITNTTSMKSVAMSDTSLGSDPINQHKHQQLIFPQPSLLVQPTFGNISSSADHTVLLDLDEQFPWSCSSPFEVSFWQHPILPGTETMPMSLTCDLPWTFSSSCSETMGNNMNLDELDKLQSANLNFPWDDLDIKQP